MTARIAVVLACAALGVGCTAVTVPGPEAPTAGGSPKYGGVLTSTFRSDPYDWDPTTAGISIGNQHGWALAYEPLLSVQLGPSGDFNDITLAPGIAERWEVSPDARTYTFHLRRGVRFANLPPVNGRELTAADVQWSYEYASRTGQFKDAKLPAAKFVHFFEGLEAVETPSPYTVVVRFAAPFAPFLSNAAEFSNPIMPREVYDTEGGFKERLIGTGPFQLDATASQKGARWVFKKHDHYWQQGRPYLDEVRWLVLPDESTLAAAFATRQVDVRPSGPETANQAKQKYANAVVYDYVTPGGTMLYMNVRRPPLSDVRVRRAVSLALDRDEFARVMNDGKAGYAVAGAFTGYFSEAEMREMLRYDPEQAKRLLAEAGYGDGLALEHFYPGNAFGEAYLNGMQLLQAQLKKVGINLTLRSFDLADYLARTRGNTFDLTLRSLSTGIDVDSFLYGSFHPNSNRNYNGVNDPKLTAMIEAQRQEPDVAKRRELVRQAARYITEQAWGLFAHGAVSYQVWQTYVMGYRPNAARSIAPFTDTWLDK